MQETYGEILVDFPKLEVLVLGPCYELMFLLAMLHGCSPLHSRHDVDVCVLKKVVRLGLRKHPAQYVIAYLTTKCMYRC